MTNKFDATLDQVTGAAKEVFGKLTGDKGVEAEGLVDQLAGKVKEVAVDLKDTVDGLKK